MSSDLNRSHRSMTKAAFCLCAISLLAGCASQAQPYSPNYHYVSVEDGSAGKGPVRKGYDMPRKQTVLVPDACTTPDTAEQPLYLPSGCANNLNLQFMVARERDLLRGRDMGPAMAAPTARAAQAYISGTQTDEQKRRQQNLGSEEQLSN